MKKEDMLLQLKELKKENKVLRFALDNIHEGVLITDEKDVIVVYNKEVEKTEGIAREKMLGRVEKEAYGNIYNYNFDQLFTKAVRKSGEAIIGAYHEYDLGRGNKTAILFDVKPVVDKDKVIAVCTIGRNINQIKEFIVDTLETQQKFNRQLGKEISGAKYFFEDIIGESATMKRLIAQAKKVALRDSPILIYGETGTGKELLGSSIHNHSLYCDGPFVTLNCAAIPEALLESILFGVAKGSYTGAVEGAGLFEQANNGTLFLDEINSMPLNLQAKLLRAVQEKRVRRLGGSKEIPVNCRIISACNQSPQEMLHSNVIREDLFFRLATVELTIPPLREHKEDLEYLIGYFLQKCNIRFGLFVEDISQNLKELLHQYDWPGNVRELENFIESSMNLVEARERVLALRHLSDYFRDKFNSMEANSNCHHNLGQEIKDKMRAYERNLYKGLLIKYNYGIANLAKDLGMTRQNVYIRLKKLGIQLPQ